MLASSRISSGASGRSTVLKQSKIACLCLVIRFIVIPLAIVRLKFTLLQINLHLEYTSRSHPLIKENFMHNIPSIHNHGSCCHTPDRTLFLTKNLNMDKVIKVVEKISLFAIGIFSAMTSFPLFIGTFAFGMGIGVWDAKNLTDRLHTHRDHALCAHGFMEHLTGVKLPAPLALAANIAILVAHIDHHATVFVPIVGMTMGIWAGRTIGANLDARCFNT